MNTSNKRDYSRLLAIYRYALRRLATAYIYETDGLDRWLNAAEDAKRAMNAARN